jgi:hypothetical protein
VIVHNGDETRGRGGDGSKDTLQIAPSLQPLFLMEFYHKKAYATIL